MSRPTSFGSAVSLLALSSMLAGCATPQKSGIREVRQVGEVGLATRAIAALNSNDVPLAIDLAERAVARTPDDAGFRALLGSAYFAGGRFASAEAAYKDSLSIYSNQPQVVLKLALVQIALGKKDEAAQFLTFAQVAINPADYGLALALAGHSAEAVAALQQAARQPGADARVRQNLALAYALSGDWIQARTIAAQDVPAAQLDERIRQWMQLANPKTASDQVASLIGVTPAAVDPGQPVRLALHKPDTRMARAAPAPAPQPQAAEVAPAPAPRVAEAPPPPAPQPRIAEAAPPPAPVPAPRPRLVETPAPAEPRVAQNVAAPPAPPPANPQRTPAVAEAASPAPVTMALMTAASKARDAVESIFAPTPPPAVKAAARPAKPLAVKAATKPVRPPAVKAAANPAKLGRVGAAAGRRAVRRGNSPAVVQIGAFRSAANVTVAWDRAARKYGALKAYMPMSARFASPKGVFYRLSVKGFASTAEAKALCKQLRRAGGACFVRNFAGDTPVQYASR